MLIHSSICMYDSRLLLIILAAHYTLPSLKHPSLRIVALNSNLYLAINQETIGKSDPAQQFRWLEDTFKSARNDGEKVGPTQPDP